MEFFEQFGINPTLLAAQIVNFTILLFLLKKFLYKPILKVLEERKTKVAQSLKDVQEIEKRLQETTSQQEKILDKAKSEAALIISEAKTESKELSEKMLSETKSSVEDMLEKTRNQMTVEKEKMMSEVKRDLTDLVIEATAKVTKKTMSGADNHRIIEETVREVSGR